MTTQAGTHFNTDLPIFPSAARIATVNSADFDNDGGWRGAVFSLDITAASGTTPTLDITIERKDVASGKYNAIPGAAFAQKTTTGQDELVIYPGVAETANESVSDILSTVLRAVATIGGTTPSFTFSLGASLIK